MSVDIAKEVKPPAEEVKKEPDVKAPEPSAVELKVAELMKRIEESDKKIAEQSKLIEKQRVESALFSIPESKREFVKKAIEGESSDFAEKFIAKVKGMPDQAAGVIPNKNGEQEKFVPDDAWKLKRAKESGYIV